MTLGNFFPNVHFVDSMWLIFIFLCNQEAEGLSACMLISLKSGHKPVWDGLSAKNLQERNISLDLFQGKTTIKKGSKQFLISISVAIPKPENRQTSLCRQIPDLNS